ncbi:MAG: hypothetical protein GY842_07620 [bacterium]|nr:hypothetical protein [bacterium]
MAKQGLKRRLLGLVTAAAMGGTVFQLGSCDPTVRTTLLTGLEQTTASLANTVITAFFVSLDDDTTDSTGLTTP